MHELDPRSHNVLLRPLVLKWRDLRFPLQVLNDLPYAIRSFTQTGYEELLHRLVVTKSSSAAIPTTAMSMAVPNRATELISQGSSTSAETSGCWLCGVCPSTLPLRPAIVEVQSMTIF